MAGRYLFLVTIRAVFAQSHFCGINGTIITVQYFSNQKKDIKDRTKLYHGLASNIFTFELQFAIINYCSQSSHSGKVSKQLDVEFEFVL